jgi:hypothetical protein
MGIMDNQLPLKPSRSKLPYIYGEIVGSYWENAPKHLVTVNVPEALQQELRYDGNTIKRITCNKDMAPALKLALQNIVERGLDMYVKDYGGCFCVRPARGSTRRSVHSWGLAIDINIHENPLGKQPLMSPLLVKCFTDVGFVWGGEWKCPDGMHFQWCIED